MCSECLLRFSKKTHVSVWYCSSISPVCTSLLNASQRGFYSIPFVLLINTGVTRIKEKTLGMWKYSDVEGSFFWGEGGGGWELVSHLLDLEVHHVSCITFNSHIIIWSYVWGIPISELSLHDDSHLSSGCVGTVMTYITAPEIELLAVSLTQVLAVVRCFLLYSPKCFYLLCVM